MISVCCNQEKDMQIHNIKQTWKNLVGQLTLEKNKWWIHRVDNTERVGSADHTIETPCTPPHTKNLSIEATTITPKVIEEATYKTEMSE